MYMKIMLYINHNIAYINSIYNLFDLNIHQIDSHLGQILLSSNKWHSKRYKWMNLYKYHNRVNNILEQQSNRKYHNIYQLRQYHFQYIPPLLIKYLLNVGYHDILDTSIPQQLFPKCPEYCHNLNLLLEQYSMNLH